VIASRSAGIPNRSRVAGAWSFFAQESPLRLEGAGESRKFASKQTQIGEVRRIRTPVSCGPLDSRSAKSAST
jgi:hypothetical protein